MRFEEKVVVITGAGRGIGFALSERFAAEGASVVIAEIDAERGTAAADSLGAHFVPIDVSNHESVHRAVDAVVAEHGRIDVWINNAGVAHKAPVVDLDVAGWDAGYRRYAERRLLLRQVRWPSNDRAAQRLHGQCFVG